MEEGMPARTRPPREPTDDWEQLRLLATWPAQTAYELLRPIVLFGRTPAKRAQETGVPERTLRRKVNRFDAVGMLSLFETPSAPMGDRRALPTEIRQAIVTLKADYPPLTAHEIATICAHRFHRPVSHHTVKKALAGATLPTEVPRRFPRYRDIADPVERRLAVVRLYLEGWTITSIAGYLVTKRDRVYAVLRRWFTEGLPGLEDRSHVPHHPARKVDLKALAAIRRLQANAELGGFRVSAALEQQGIVLSPRTCQRILALHRALGAAQRPAAEPREPLPHPFAATRRHQIWSVDIRYIEDHGLPTDKPVYVIAILENYSRALLASLLSPRQDLTAYLVLLREAIREHGAPELLVSDSGSVFLATQAKRIYAALGIEKREIERGQPWQNYIEANFGTMRRMADYHFARATTWAEMHGVHGRFFHDYNTQAHWAHRDRLERKRSPAAVLGLVHGAWCDPAALDRLFRVRHRRRVDASGYVRYLHWRLYGDRGLPGVEAAVWVLGETVTVEYGTDALAQYRVAYEPDERHIRAVTDVHLFETRYPSSQPFLPELADMEWQPALRLPRPARRLHRPRADTRQLPLLDDTQATAT
jgi:putative transposase